VLAWSRAGSVLALYLAFAGIGLAGAAVLYEPAFATLNAYFDTQRQNALLTLTMVAGLASTIFVPAAALLITHLGWRDACSPSPPSRQSLRSPISCYCGGAPPTRAGNATAPPGFPAPPGRRRARIPRPRPRCPPGKAKAWPMLCAAGPWRS
jgi:MFS family permease